VAPAQPQRENANYISIICYASRPNVKGRGGTAKEVVKQDGNQLATKNPRFVSGGTGAPPLVGTFYDCPYECHHVVKSGGIWGFLIRSKGKGVPD